MKEPEIYKHKLAEEVSEIISYEGLTDLTDWVEKNGKEGYKHNGVARSVAYILEAKGNFQVEKLEDKSRYFVKALPKKLLRDKNPLLFQTIVICITVFITTIAGYIVQLTQHQELRLKEYQQDVYLQRLSDSLKKIQTEITVLKDTSSIK